MIRDQSITQPASSSLGCSRKSDHAWTVRSRGCVAPPRLRSQIGVCEDPRLVQRSNTAWANAYKVRVAILDPARQESHTHFGMRGLLPSKRIIDLPMRATGRKICFLDQFLADQMGEAS